MIRKGKAQKEEFPGQQKRRISFLAGFLILMITVIVLVIIVSGLSAVLRVIPGVGRSVGVLSIEGAIYDTKEHIDMLHNLKENYSIKAIVIRIDSPGGVVGGVQELYEEIKKVRKETQKPVIASMGSLAASGGYYAACGAQEIFANPGTVTGSIGVVMTFPNAQKVFSKVGVRMEVIKSGEHKDIGSMFREMTDQERELLQDVVDDTYEQFLNVIMDARQRRLRQAFSARHESEKTTESLAMNAVEQELRLIADGRVFSGRQAQELGLVDRLGNLQDAIDRAAKLAGIVGKPRVVYPKRHPSIWSIFTGKFFGLIKQVTHSHPSLEYRLISP